jgi:CheY-like chemotaxis protein/HPt (histidine-containing phosphotransfer) domain-containing protein
VVDDDATNRQLLLLSLAHLGYSADTACDGAEAVSANERRPYDLILMDMEMAGMDGLEATRQIRRRLTDTPGPCIIACTANTTPSVRDMCIEAGMTDFMLKPVQPDLLAELIERYTSGDQERAEPHTAAALLPRPPMLLNEQLLDGEALTRLRRVVGEDPAAFALVVESFLDDTPRLVATIRDAVASEQAEEVHRAAHTLKSLAATFGAMGLASLCREVEQNAASGAVPSEAHMRALRQSYEHVVVSLTALIRG